MTRLMTLILSATALFTVVLFQNCAPGMDAGDATANRASKAVTREEISDLYARLNFLNAQDLSCAASSDCFTLGIGARACGGVQTYLVGGRTLRTSIVTSLATELTEKERLYNQQNQIVSTCIVIVEPETECVAGRCQAKPNQDGPVNL